MSSTQTSLQVPLELHSMNIVPYPGICTGRNGAESNALSRPFFLFLGTVEVSSPSSIERACPTASWLAVRLFSISISKKSEAIVTFWPLNQGSFKLLTCPCINSTGLVIICEPYNEFLTPDMTWFSPASTIVHGHVQHKLCKTPAPFVQAGKHSASLLWCFRNPWLTILEGNAIDLFNTNVGRSVSALHGIYTLCLLHGFAQWCLLLWTKR